MSDHYLGQIQLFGCNFAPAGWATCAGQVIAISQNTALFSLLGTMYGGDGKSTFRLPDLRGRVPIGFGPGAGLSNRTIGEETGVETVTLTPAQMPAHAHPLDVTALTVTRECRTAAATAGTPVNNLPADEINAATFSYGSGETAANMRAGAMVFTGGMTAAASGGSFPHSNLQPYIVLNYCIATQGVFPPRS